MKFIKNIIYKILSKKKKKNYTNYWFQLKIWIIKRIIIVIQKVSIKTFYLYIFYIILFYIIILLYYFIFIMLKRKLVFTFENMINFFKTELLE